MRILVIHQYYLVAGTPGGSRFNEMARVWSGAGHAVEVVAGTLNYASGEVPPEYRGKWNVREQDGDVTVWRCHVPAAYRRGYVGRMWAFFAFTLSATTAVLRARRPDVVIATSPPLVAFIPGWIAARRPGRRVPWIAEVRDLWPESAITTGVIRARGFLARMLYALERWAYRSADRINVLTPAFRRDIVERGLATEEKVIFIPNGADADLFRPGPRDNWVRTEYGWKDRFVVLYSGAHGRANALGQLLEAAEHLRDREDILIACVGDGPEREGLIAAAARRGLTNIAFLGPQPKEKMPDFVNACDLGAAVLQDNATFRTVYPNKVFDYMACERPTLLAIDGAARELVCDEAQAGVFAEPENGAAIAAAIVAVADDRPRGRAMGQRGRAWVLAHATRQRLAERYLAEMDVLTGGSVS